ncbi:tight adherence protein B [Formivibrio citricus]|uniref:Tight adherence protein B n=1 Tax=Formivibrio citricus TaxID=83765 RepID=A0A1I4WZI0_9NEIS|nr:type II secretion system F family protein [Formivibrio citricus]SFN18782.1 tight adherence protein B [Formivibrio citricus]
MDYLYYAFVVLGFFAVVLFLEGAYLTWNTYRGPEARRIEERLRALSAGSDSGTQELSIVKNRLLSETPALDRLLMQIPRIHHLDRLLLQSGMRINVAGFFGLSLLAAGLGLTVSAILSFSAFFIVAIMILAGFLPLFMVLNSRQKRLDALEQQLPDTLDLMARALRAGHALPGALKTVGEEMPEPIAGEFRITFDELNYGIPLSEALNNMASRVPVTDLRYFVISVLIQRETGGNLAELLDNISALIRARFKLLGAIRVLSAEGRLSAWILTILPFALAGVIRIIHPQFIGVLWSDPFGRKMVFGALILMLLGIFWMWRIIKIRV